MSSQGGRTILRIYRRRREQGADWVLLQTSEYQRLLTAPEAEHIAAMIFDEWDCPVRAEFTPVLQSAGGIPGTSDLWKD